jgi:CelD/BcsL family acetyltransferase involved in cellulose biosynthesis
MSRLIDARTAISAAGLAEHRFASLFSSPLWIEAIAQSYGFAISAATTGDNGVAEGALLFAHIADARGERIVCLPFSDYCDPLLENAAAWAEVIEPVLAFGVPVTLRVLRNDLPARDERFTTTGTALWHAVDLERAESELWAGLSGSARQNVRKARRNGVVLRAGRSLEDVRTFHRMHCDVRKSKYRLLAQPLAFFDNLHALFAPEDRLTVLLAEVGGAAIAGIFLLEWGDTLYYKFNASVDQRLRPNDLLAWEGIRLGQERGLARFDFGLSDPEQTGLVRYKQKFATEERVISLLRWQPAAHVDPRAEEVGRAFGRMTHLLTDPSVPDAITRAAGDELYRYFC